ARSIGALAGVAVAALVVLAVGLTRVRSRAIRAALVVVAIFAVVVTAAIAAAKLGGNDASITVRAATLRIGLAAMQERPWLGFGANGFPHESARIERALFGHELLELHPANQPFSAHDAYMNVAVERGVGALIAFLGLLGVLGMFPRVGPPAFTLPIYFERRRTPRNRIARLLYSAVVWNYDLVVVERVVEIPFVLQNLPPVAHARILDFGCTESPLPIHLA